MIWINPGKKSLSASVRFRPKLLLFTLLPHELSKSVNYSSERTIAAVPQADVAGQEIPVTITAHWRAVHKGMLKLIFLITHRAKTLFMINTSGMHRLP
jgi:hypothetical protein